jgi:sporulation protein YlmC with PRC-barrel domain
MELRALPTLRIAAFAALAVAACLPAWSVAVEPEMPASVLLGMDVVNLAGEEAVELEDLAIDPATGKVAYALLSLGGFAGLGEKRIALPFSALTVGMENEVLVADLERRQSASAAQDLHLWRARAVIRQPPVVDLIVDMEAGRVTYAVLKHAIVPFAGLSGHGANGR